MNASRLALVLIMMLVSVAAAEQAPTTRQTGFSREAYRIVDRNDEVIAVLENGMTVIARRVQSPVLAVRAYVRTGGVYEGKWLGGGLSHLLEHLVAGGTNQRRSEEENRNLLQRIGNNSNAYTTYDHTCYYVNTTSDHLDEAVDLVAGWVLGAKITPEEYAREYEVVQRELEMNKGEPDSIFWHLMQANRYRVSPARVPVIGYQQVIQGLTRDDVYNYYRLAYQANNLVFAVAGDVAPERMLAAIKANVAEAPPGREFAREIAGEPPVLAPRHASASFPKLGQAKLDLSFPSVKLDHPDLYALDLLATIMGSGDSSILVEELRDRRQLVSSVECSDFTPAYIEGSFSVTMELDPGKIDQATRAVLEVVERVKTQPIDASRIARAKTQMRADRVKELQTSEAVVSALATDLLSSGDPHFGQRYVDRIQKVTAEELRWVAERYLDPARLLTTSLLPAESVSVAAPPATQNASAETFSQVNRIQLKNGAVLLHKQITTSPVVEVRMFALGGLTAEDEKTNGLGNLTMTMLPRGTRSRSAQQIAEFFDQIGANIVTGCGNNSWFWHLTCLKEDIDKAFEVYADVVNDPAFPETELPAVKQRIIADIEEQDADWHAQAMRFFRKSYFGPQDSPYQFNPTGQVDAVSQATAAQLGHWYDRVLKGPRVIAIFGDVGQSQAMALANQYLAGGRVEAGPIPQGAEPDGPGAGHGMPAITVERVEIQKTAQPLAGVVIGFNSQSLVGSAAVPGLLVIDTMTSGYGYPTGYLFDVLRGRGLVYVVHAAEMPGVRSEFPGTFLVYAGCDPSQVNQVVDLILENIARCQGSEKDMQDDWFARSKKLIITGQALDNETAGQQAETAALDELYGLGYDYRDRLSDRINAVTIDRVRQVARARLNGCVVTISTPAPEVVKVTRGQREYRSFPPVTLTPQGVQHDTVK